MLNGCISDERIFLLFYDVIIIHTEVPGAEVWGWWEEHRQRQSVRLFHVLTWVSAQRCARPPSLVIILYIFLVAFEPNYECVSLMWIILIKE